MSENVELISHHISPPFLNCGVTSWFSQHWLLHVAALSRRSLTGEGAEPEARKRWG